MSYLDDIIFRNRNRKYGAYRLRKRSVLALFIAVITAISLYVSAFIGFYIYYSIPDDFGDEEWYYYDNSSMSNPFQPDLELYAEQKKDEGEKDNSDFKVVENPLAADTAEKKSENSGQQGDSLSGGSDSLSAGGDTLYRSDLNIDSYDTEDYELLTRIDKPPMFPGGEGARIAFLQKNIVYPEFAQKNRIEGPVYVTFIVEADSSITHIQILQGIGAGCDEEALRVARAMPRWTPGIKNGEAVRFQITMPLLFTIYTQ